MLETWAAVPRGLQDAGLILADRLEKCRGWGAGL